jgi:hypothetical protein
LVKIRPLKITVMLGGPSAEILGHCLDDVALPRQDRQLE